MRAPKRIFLPALVAVAIAAAGCGGDKEGKGIPVATADGLHTQLENVQARIDQGSAGACKDIIEAPASRGSNKQQVQDLIDSMPDDVDADVKSALQDSFDHLWDLVDQDCQDKSDKENTNNTPTDTTPTDTTPTDTTPTDTTPTDTTPTDTTPTDTTTETSPDTAPLPNDGNGNGALPGADNGGGVGPDAQKQDKEKKK